MAKIAVFGAGRLGISVTERLSAADVPDVFLLDVSEDALEVASDDLRKVFVSGLSSLPALLSKGDIVVSTLVGSERVTLARAASKLRCHYLDFSEEPNGAREILSLPNNGTSTLIPSCGFSPGLLSNLITRFVSGIEGVLDLNVYAGVVPVQKNNRLGFAQVMNIDGLMEEYLKPCTVKQDGVWLEVSPLSGLESIVLDGTVLEAFATGGTTNELPTAVSDRVRNYSYRTVRYPGHLDYMNFLLEDLGLKRRRDIFSTLLRNGLPHVQDDQIFIHLAASRSAGAAGREVRQQTWRIRATSGDRGVLYEIASRHAAAIVDLLRDGTLAGKGPLRQEDMDPSMVLSNSHLREAFRE